MKYFNFLSKKEFLIQLIFLMIIFVLVACDGSYSDTKNGTHNLGNNSNNLQDDASNVDSEVKDNIENSSGNTQNDSPVNVDSEVKDNIENSSGNTQNDSPVVENNQDNNSDIQNSNLPLQYMELEDIDYSFKPSILEIVTDIDLSVTLPLNKNFTIYARNKNNSSARLNLKVTSDDENIARVVGSTITSVNPGIAKLTVTSVDGNYEPILLQVVVPPKVELYSELGTGWWYQQIKNDNDISEETRNNMLKLYEMILQKPGTPFNDPKANIIPIPGEKLKYDEIRTAYWAVKLDYPELFWLKSNFIYYFNTPTMSIHNVFSSLEDFEIKTKEHNVALEKFINEIKDKLKLDSRNLLHEIFLKLEKIPYEIGALDSSSGIGSNWEIHSSYGTLHKKKAVCDGLSSAFALIVKKLQTDNNVLDDVYLSMIVGKPYKNSEPTHAWNMVKYQNQWSEIDITYAKTLSSNNFMVTNDDRQFVLGHNLGISYKLIVKYIPFAKERNQLFYDYTKK